MDMIVKQRTRSNTGNDADCRARMSFFIVGSDGFPTGLGQHVVAPSLGDELGIFQAGQHTRHQRLVGLVGLTFLALEHPSTGYGPIGDRSRALSSLPFSPRPFLKLEDFEAQLIHACEGGPGPWGFELERLRREAVVMGLSFLGYITLIRVADYAIGEESLASDISGQGGAVHWPVPPPYNSLKRIVTFDRGDSPSARVEEAMPDFDRDTLKRSIQALRSGNPSRHRSVKRRNMQPELTAVDSQFRKESLETLEGALTQAGIDVRKLRATLARNQKKSLDRVAALRLRAEASEHPEVEVASGTSSRFQSLQVLAGRAVPLDQPSSLTFLTEPVDIASPGISER
jgi:hypothetical protein